MFRGANNITPCTQRQKPATKVDMLSLEKDVQYHPDDYQWERAKRLGVCQPTIHYALKRTNITFKKNTKTP
ncbi:MAG: hypothetical protein JKX90_02190 [Colwellia sp.]|nr:hypothetical protein [Colwellia sp.]